VSEGHTIGEFRRALPSRAEKAIQEIVDREKKCTRNFLELGVTK
jgi:hypothetical protein